MVDSRSSRPVSSLASRSDGRASSPTSRRTAPHGPDAARGLEVWHQDSDGLVASVEGGLILVAETLSPPMLAAMARSMARLSARHGKFFTLTVSERKSGSGVTPERRTATAALLRRHAQYLSCSAVVCEGTGFRATAVRSVVTALHMASMATHPIQVFDNTSAATAWVHGKQGEPKPGLAELRELLALARSRYREQRSAAPSPEPAP